jgi:hypothetical protein
MTLDQPFRLLAALVLLVAAAVPARAASASDDEARAAFEHATAQFALHHFADAAQAYEKAFELRPDPALLYNAAQSHRLAGNNARALELYQSLLRLYGDRLRNRAEVIEHIQKLNVALDAEHRAPRATPVTSAPPPATPPPAATSRPATTTPSPAPLAATKPATTTTAMATTTGMATTPAPTPEPSATQPASPSPSSPSPSLVPAAAVERAPSPRPRRLWIWGVVAGGAVVVAGAIVLGVVLNPKNPTPSLGAVRPQ